MTLLDYVTTLGNKVNILPEYLRPVDVKIKRNLTFSKRGNQVNADYFLQLFPTVRKKLSICIKHLCFGLHNKKMKRLLDYALFALPPSRPEDFPLAPLPLEVGHGRGPKPSTGHILIFHPLCCLPQSLKFMWTFRNSQRIKRTDVDFTATNFASYLGNSISISKKRKSHLIQIHNAIIHVDQKTINEY